LADEPTASLDQKSGREIVDIIKKMAREIGVTVVLVTHDNRILDIADRIISLVDGTLQTGAARDGKR
ncbi:ABC transporter ATP-binding protein, partial [Escherichia coli]|nr:ABC transporter ATP-binding protein [Escherichia coli]